MEITSKTESLRSLCNPCTTFVFEGACCALPAASIESPSDLSSKSLRPAWRRGLKSTLQALRATLRWPPLPQSSMSDRDAPKPTPSAPPQLYRGWEIGDGKAVEHKYVEIKGDSTIRFPPKPARRGESKPPQSPSKTFFPLPLAKPEDV